jgi:hypothetical protein
MDPNEWRITKQAVEVEMLKLASLLKPELNQTLVGPSSLRATEVLAVNTVLRKAVGSFKLKQ